MNAVRAAWGFVRAYPRAVIIAFGHPFDPDLSGLWLTALASLGALTLWSFGLVRGLLTAEIADLGYALLFFFAWVPAGAYVVYSVSEAGLLERDDSVPRDGGS